MRFDVLDILVGPAGDIFKLREAAGGAFAVYIEVLIRRPT